MAATTSAAPRRLVSATRTGTSTSRRQGRASPGLPELRTPSPGPRPGPIAGAASGRRCRRSRGRYLRRRAAPAPARPWPPGRRRPVRRPRPPRQRPRRPPGGCRPTRANVSAPPRSSPTPNPAARIPTPDSPISSRSSANSTKSTSAAPAMNMPAVSSPTMSLASGSAATVRRPAEEPGVRGRSPSRSIWPQPTVARSNPERGRRREGEHDPGEQEHRRGRRHREDRRGGQRPHQRADPLRDPGRPVRRGQVIRSSRRVRAGAPTGSAASRRTRWPRRPRRDRRSGWVARPGIAAAVASIAMACTRYPSVRTRCRGKRSPRVAAAGATNPAGTQLQERNERRPTPVPSARMHRGGSRPRSRIPPR